MEFFSDKAIKGIIKKNSVLCVGFDPQLKHIPEHVLQEGWKQAKDKTGFEPIARAFVIFNTAIARSTVPFATFAKLQMAFYEKYGAWGVWAFEETKRICEEVSFIVIEDAKRGDGGATAEAYASGHLGVVEKWDGNEKKVVKVPSFNLDAMTVHGYIGSSCIDEFVKVIKECGKGIFIVDKTSFKPNSEIEQMTLRDDTKVWQGLAKLALDWGKGAEGELGYSNVGVVMGATYPEDAVIMRQIMGENCLFLIPGYGAGQGGGADAAITGINNDGFGVVNSSRGISGAYLKGSFECSPYDYAEASAKSAEFSNNELNEARRRAGKLLE